MNRESISFFEEFNTLNGDEIDKMFATHLEKDCSLVCEKIEKARNIREFFDITKSVFVHLYGQHLKLVRNDFDGLLDVTFSAEDFLREHTDEIPFIIKERCKEIYKGLPILPFTFINETMYAEMQEIDLFLHNRKLLYLFHRYKKLFGKVYESKADELFCIKLEEVFTEREDLFEKTKEDFLKVYRSYAPGALKDYYILEPFLAAGVRCGINLALLITAFESGKEKKASGIGKKIGNIFNKKIPSMDEVFEVSDSWFADSAAMRERTVERIRALF